MAGEIELDELNDRGERAHQHARDRDVFNTKEEVNRELTWLHIIFITISGVLGAGLYVRSGAMLEVGGPAAVIIPYVMLSLLAWSIMQCIGEMLIIWPVSNALVLFVREFVDPELGTLVGVAYWFTYSVGFSSLLTAAASEAAIWSCSKVVQGVLLLGVPLICLPMVNLFGVRYYGWTEVVGGILKSVTAVVIFLLMIVINVGVGPDSKDLGFTYWGDFFSTNPAEVPNWGVAFFIALQTGAFSFIGIEIPAVTALEAKMDVAASDLDQTSNQHVGEWPITTARKALWLSCGRLPILVGPLYLLMGLVASLNVDRANPGLPSQRNEPVDHSYIANCAKSDSIFVISAVASRIPYLGDVFTAFVLLAAWTSANTALYVSSRTLYGLTRHYQNLPMDKNWGPLYTLWWRCRRWPGRTWKTMKGKNIPIPALIVSTILFCWVPFLQVARVASATQILYILTEIGSVFCVLVWGCECLAFLRFMWALKKWSEQINDNENENFRDLRRFPPTQEQAETRLRNAEDLYPWRTKPQPFHAWFGMIGCAVIVVAAGGARLWSGWTRGAPVSFTAGYLPVILFVSFWLLLKVIYRGRGRWFRPGILSTWENGFRPVLEDMHGMRAQRFARG